MQVEVLNHQFTGLAHSPLGSVAVVRARITTGMLWWKKRRMAWAVTAVCSHFDYLRVEHLWSVIKIFDKREDADRLASEMSVNEGKENG